MKYKYQKTRKSDWKPKLCSDGYWRLNSVKYDAGKGRKRETKEDCERYIENILTDLIEEQIS